MIKKMFSQYTQLRHVKVPSLHIPQNQCFCTSLYEIHFITKIQPGPRYEGQLNHMAEPIPHVIHPLVRTHVYHPYLAVDRQAETDSLALTDADVLCAPILSAI